MAKYGFSCKYRERLSQFLHIATFIAIMVMIFHLTFNVVGKAMQELLAKGIEATCLMVEDLMKMTGVSFFFRSMVTDGIFPGVGSVLSFAPVIGVLFFFLSLLQESRYLYFVSALLDPPMRRMGLNGQAVIPMVMGFGCNVPAIITAGSLLRGRTKFTVMAMIPFMSCSARLPIYLLYISTFFERHRLLVLFCVYGAGVGIAFITALILKKDVSGEPSHGSQASPSAGVSALISTSLGIAWQNCLNFVKKAFAVILPASVIIWFLQNFDASLQLTSDSSESLLAILGRAAVPVFAPLGFEDWQAVSALISGLFAKEAVISTLAVLSGGGLSALLTDVFTPLSAFCFMIFCLLYIPCIATMAAIHQETGSLRFCLALGFFQIITAWLVSFLLFQGGTFIMQL